VRLPTPSHVPLKTLRWSEGNRGRQYTFDCTAQRPAGHFHPDITMGKCVFFFGPEELRMNYGSDWTQPHKLKYASLYRPQVDAPRRCGMCIVPRRAEIAEAH
jgi:hypothetical protein